jgi:hypothetical protein
MGLLLFVPFISTGTFRFYMPFQAKYSTVIAKKGGESAVFEEEGEYRGEYIF